MYRCNAVRRSICLNFFLFFITSRLIIQKQIHIDSETSTIIPAACFIKYYETLAARNGFKISLAVDHSNQILLVLVCQRPTLPSRSYRHSLVRRQPRPLILHFLKFHTIHKARLSVLQSQKLTPPWGNVR
jgi:hypothetical protein